ncbi:DUF4124 domain-containing protein [Stutzerimonas azotifigens]|uniref:DUF4124 domain-containing protein n=1 Tax=Stutzerimonas azotifigens TaxID=291995 RepID=UPI000424E994|nr:DUF4124 domain-containing protein [Stutzerimonas azotifigens]
MRTWILLASLWPALATAEIYRWTDEQGRVHFSERAAAGAERVEVRPQVVEQDAARQAQASRWFEARREERQAQAQADAEQRQQRAQECAQLRQRLEWLSQGGRHFRTDASGERHYYSEEQLRAARQGLADRMNGSCG